MCFDCCVTSGKTSALPNVYRNSFTAGIMETTNAFTYPESGRYELTIRKRDCNSCSSSQTAAWNNVTTLPTYDNFTAISQIKTTTIRFTPPNKFSIWRLLGKLRDIVGNTVVSLSLVTNSLSIAVFIRMRRKIQSNLILVFVSLSVVDTFALSLKFNAAVALMSRKMALLYYSGGCQILRWLESSGEACSSLSLIHI